MEGGNPLVEYLTYGVLGLVALALGILLLRSAWFFLSLLAIPLTETVGRWRPFRGAVQRWGERGAAADEEAWGAQRPAAPRPAHSGAGSPRAVRVGMRVGALLGALPGLWIGVRDAGRAAATSGSTDAMWALVMGVALVGGAGLLVGIALGAGAGIAIAAARRD